jgi:hypothetical protein
MNWLQKIFCDHQWEKIYSHASLSMTDRSGTIELGESCTKCMKSRGHVIIRGANGRIEREYVF